MGIGSISLNNGVRVVQVSVPGTNPVVPTTFTQPDVADLIGGGDIGSFAGAWLADASGVVVSSTLQFQTAGMPTPPFYEVTVTPPTTASYVLNILCIG